MEYSFVCPYYDTVVNVKFYTFQQYQQEFEGSAQTETDIDTNTITVRMIVDKKQKEYKPNTDIQFNTLLHETCHIKQGIEKCVCTKFDDETEAYILSWLYDRMKDIYKQYCKNNRLRNNIKE